MAKVTFVYPDFECIGVEYLMSACIEAGHEADLAFYNAQDMYVGMSVKNVPYEEVARRIACAKPHVAAFSCVTDNFRFQLKCAEELKAKHPEIITVFGGVHPTAVPERVLGNDAVDAVAMGEGEVSFVELLNLSDKDSSFELPENPVKGIVHKKGDRIVGEFVVDEIADIDSVPFPYKEYFIKYLADARHEYRIMTSRDCPYSCSYCFNAHMQKLRGKHIVRQRSVENVIDELVLAKSKYNHKYIIFLDDCFTLKANWLLSFCERYKEEIGIPFACISSPLCMDREKAEALGKAGCVNMQIGIQSLSLELCRDVLSRKSDNEKSFETITDLHRAGIMAQIDHMLGIPNDTLKNQEDAALFYNRCRPKLITIFWLTYYPKTPIVDFARNAGILSDSDVEKIENGLSLTRESYLSGGSLRDPRPYYAISFLLNWLPLLPRPIVFLLVKLRLYHLLRIRSYFLSTALPRGIQSIFNPRDFRGRSHLLRFFENSKIPVIGKILSMMITQH